MKKSKLVIDYEFDFELIGITTPARGYKLAWEINQRLGVHLTRQNDLVVGFKKNDEKSFTYYAFQTPLNRLKLFKNKPSVAETPSSTDTTRDKDVGSTDRPGEKDAGKYFLIPEFPHFDFIILTSMVDQTPEQLIELIKTIPSIQLAARIPLEGLKSKSNFIF